MPEGAAIGYKPLAAHIAAYGQQACAKALRFLSDAGHLRHVKQHLMVEDNSFRWVTRTYFSRTARDDAWWKTFVDGLLGIDLTARERAQRASGSAGVSASAESTERTERTPGPEPEPEPARTPVPAATPTPAYRLLAGLGRTEPRMTLSAAECEALEALAAEWLARGVVPEQLSRTLTDGLPHPLHSPGALARKRLETKMPPKPISPPPAYTDEAWMVCISCEADERTTRIVRGVCVECREDMETYEASDDPPAPSAAPASMAAAAAPAPVPGFIPATFRAGPATGVDIAARAAEARAAGGLRSRRGE
ncbi:hypothetical protein [Streptomyces paludis]|uniref:hypothetical protein n=1 Tax=Streptomyces paludis TaxID=2282738 RepID=UPI001E33E48F|nr:hypothetical protein [Streptomyces paludis]